MAVAILCLFPTDVAILLLGVANRLLSHEFPCYIALSRSVNFPALDQLNLIAPKSPRWYAACAVMSAAQCARGDSVHWNLSVSILSLARFRCSHAGRLSKIYDCQDIFYREPLSASRSSTARPPSPRKPIASAFFSQAARNTRLSTDLRDGLKELGLEEGKQFTLVINDTKGDASVTEQAAKAFEKDNVNLIYALTTMVITKRKIRHD